MKPKKSRRRPTLPACAEDNDPEFEGDEDVGPRTSRFRSARRKRIDRKTLQLCGQAARTLNLFFAGGCADEMLAGLTVESVEPAPDSGHLMVTLRSCDSSGTNEALVLERLGPLRGRLRH